MGERIDLDGEWERVSLRYAWVDAISTVVWGAIVTAAATVPTALLSGGDILFPLLVGVPLGVLFIAIAVFSFLRVRTIGFMLRSDDMLVRRGMLFRRFVAVPYGRMQVVDITQGPVERIWSLKTLKFVTAAASSNVTLPGLEGDRAERLRDHLVAVAESRRAGL